MGIALIEPSFLRIRHACADLSSSLAKGTLRNLRGQRRIRCRRGERVHAGAGARQSFRGPLVGAIPEAWDSAIWRMRDRRGRLRCSLPEDFSLGGILHRRLGAAARNPIQPVATAAANHAHGRNTSAFGGTSCRAVRSSWPFGLATLFCEYARFGGSVLLLCAVSAARLRSLRFRQNRGRFERDRWADRIPLRPKPMGDNAAALR